MAGLLSRERGASTARVRALGSGGVALGGMIGAADQNPAVLGFFKKHAIQVTPRLNFYRSQLSHSQDDTQEAYAIRPNVGLGGVYSNYVGDHTESDFKGGAFMLSINRNERFEKFNYANSDASQTLLNYYASEASGKSRNELLHDWQLAPLEAHHLLISDSERKYRSLLEDAPAQQLESYRQRATDYQMYMGYGLNYENRLYLGISSTLGFLRHRRTRDYQESYAEYLDNLSVIDHLSSRGTSIQMSLGLIYRPVSPLRIGLSVESPTIYNINEQTSYDWTTNFDSYTNKENEAEVLNRLQYESDLLKANYGLRTPYRLHGGASYFFGSSGFISGQISLTDYKSMYIFSDDFNTTATNQRIDKHYNTALNYFLGGEFRFLPLFYLRAGYSYRSSAIAEIEATQHYTLGWGYQRGIIDTSISLERVGSKETYQPFQSATIGTLKTQSFLLFFTTTFFIYD